jgi:type II secretory ATPase GspE/PulE/Tfp pilus assembly ATPase PilB-like protein
LKRGSSPVILRPEEKKRRVAFITLADATEASGGDSAYRRAYNFADLKTLKENGMELVTQGITTVDEAPRVLPAL